MVIEKVIEKILKNEEGRYRQLFNDEIINEVMNKKGDIIDITLEDEELLRNLHDSVEESIRIYVLRKI